MAAAAKLSHAAHGVALPFEGERVAHFPGWPFRSNDDARVAQLEELPRSYVELVA